LVDIPSSALEIVGLASDDRIFYAVFTGDGTLLTGQKDLPVPPDYRPSSRLVYFDAHYDGEDVRFVLHGRRLTGVSGAQWVVVQIGQTRQARDEMQQRILINGLSLIVLISALGACFIWVALRRSLAPLKEIEAELSARDPTDLAPLQATPPREIETLLSSINGFIQRLKANQEHLQAFIADVAHQTRTSLSALQGQLDLAHRQNDLSDIQARVAKADLQCQRTIRLTNQLLAHAMVIHRADHIPRTSVDLLALAKTVLEEAVRDTLDQDLDFGLDLVPPTLSHAWVVGDPVALREALRNLLDNAVKHGPANNRIDVGIEVLDPDGKVLLTVADAGKGIDPTHYDSVFERFSSVDGKASTKGFGLGLAIVRAVVDSHHGSITLSPSVHGGLCVSITLQGASP
jgi:two-component system sensor histidine kinase TctE